MSDLPLLKNQQYTILYWFLNYTVVAQFICYAQIFVIILVLCPSGRHYMYVECVIDVRIQIYTCTLRLVHSCELHISIFGKYHW